MNFVWGILMVLVGLFMIVNAYTKSDFFIYKLIVARSKLLWGDNVHSFLLVVGVILVGLSSLFFLGVWG